MALSFNVLNVQAILKNEDPRYLVHEIGVTDLVLTIHVETSYPLDADVARKLENLFRHGAGLYRVAVFYFSMGLGYRYCYQPGKHAATCSLEPRT